MTLLKTGTGSGGFLFVDLDTRLDAAEARLDSAETVLPAPALNGVYPLLPVSGSTMTLKAVNASNGTDTVNMSRFRVPVADDVNLFAPVWAGWGIQQDVDPADSGALLKEVDVPNTVRVSAAVETLDGRLFQLSAGGSRQWTVQPGGEIQNDPVDIDVKASDGYFWLRCRVEVDAGDVWWEGRAVSTTVSGEKVVKYTVDPTLNYQTAVLALTPNVYWSLDAATGGTDLSGSGNTGVAKTQLGALGGTTIGAALGAFPGGGTEFNGFDQVVGSSYAPFIAGQPFSAAGMAYQDTAGIGTLIGGDGAGLPPSLRILANGDVDFVPLIGGTHVTWTGAWSGLTGAWTHWAFTFDDAANTTELWVNGVSKGSKACPSNFDATAGNFQVGGFQNTTSPFDGRMVHVAGFANQSIVQADVDTMYAAFLTEVSDQTAATGALSTLGSSSATSGNAHAPVLLAGKFGPLVRKPIVSIWGDSITEGVGDTPDATDGFATKACRNANIPSVKCGKGSERGVTQTVSSRLARRLAMADGATHAIYEHGTNDYRSPVTRSTPVYLTANTTINAYRLKNRGQKVYATTLVPAASSTDVWATLGNQTVHVQDSWRTRYNDWLRAGAPLAQTTLTVAGVINGATISNLGSTASFPTSGVAIIDGNIIHYTGKTATTLTGCAAAIAPYAAAATVSIPAGTLVFAPTGWVATTAAATQTLPLATINVLAGQTTDGFSSSGTLIVGCVAGTGNQTVTYTGKTSGSFTGCSGGSGAIGSSGILQDLTVPSGVILSGSANHPLEGYFDTADAVESARNSGKWVVSTTGDGVHPNAAGHTLMAAAINTNLFVVE